MPRRSEHDDSEWMIRKDDILKLYLEQDKSLSEVIRAMATQGFTRTKPQYERSFKRWRVSKNVRKEEWDFILGRLDERKRPTNVTVRGIAIPQSRVERQRMRTRETTFDRCVSRYHPRRRCQTPEGIEISSPLPVSDHEDLQQGESQIHYVEASQSILEASDAYVESPLLPGRDPPLSPSCTALVSTTVPSPGTNPYIESANFAMAEIRRLDSLECTTVGSMLLSGPLYDHICHFVYDRYNDSILSATDRHYLFQHYHPFKREDIDCVYHPVLKMFIKYTTPEEGIESIATSTEDKDDLLLLQTLLFINQFDPKWRFFGSRLLRAAVIHGNLPLLEAATHRRNGINDYLDTLDLPRPWEFNLGSTVLRRQTALQLAVRSRRKDVIERLCNRGATILTSYPKSERVFIQDAVEDELMDLVQPLLARLATSGKATAQYGTRLLNQVVRNAEGTMMDILLQAGFSPYDSFLEWATGYSSFEHLVRKFDTPFLAAFYSYCKECTRLSAGPAIDLRRAIIKKLIDYPTASLDKEQHLSRRNQIFLAYLVSTCVRPDPELVSILGEATGLYFRDIMTTAVSREQHLVDEFVITYFPELINSE